MLSLYLSIGTAFFATLALTFLLRPVARTLDFVDRPGGRKQHLGEVPVIGGIAMFIGLQLGLSVLPNEVRPPLSFTATAFIFVCLGLLDDRFNLPSVLRLMVQVGSVIAMAVAGALSVHYVGEPFGVGTTVFAPSVALFVTVMLVVGAVNALNMVDGTDGLAGVMGLVALLGISAVAFYGANAPVLSVSGVLAASVVGFLIFNLPLQMNRSVRVFMGDAGSMMIGFSIAWMMVSLSQDPSTPVAPVMLLWLAALPIYDMVSTAWGRLRRGRSPLSADNTHLHHELKKAGFSDRGTLIILAGLAITLAAVGALLELALEVPEWASLAGFILAGWAIVGVLKSMAKKPAVI